MNTPVQTIQSLATSAATTSTSAATLDLASLKPGTTLAARVTAVADGNLAQLLTATGSFTARLPQPATVGSALTFQVMPGNEGPQLALLSTGTNGTAPVATGATGAAGAPAGVTGGAMPAPMPAPAGASGAIMTHAATREAVRAAVATDVARQDGGSRIMAMASALSGAAGMQAPVAASLAATLPAPVSEALAALVGIRLSLDQPPKASDLRKALERSGVFAERDALGKGKSGVMSAGASPQTATQKATAPAQDLKSALAQLMAALGGESEIEATAPAKGPAAGQQGKAANPAPATGGNLDNGSDVNVKVSATKADTSLIPAKSASPTQKPADPQGTTPQAQAQTSTGVPLAGEEGALDPAAPAKAAEAILAKVLATNMVRSGALTQAGAPAQPDPYGADLKAADQTPAAGAKGDVRPPPPAHDRLPSAQAAGEAGTLPADRESLMHHLRQAAGDALSRLRLVQVANMAPDRDAARVDAASQLQAEIPLSLGDKTLMLSVRVEREHEEDTRRQGREKSEPAWRMRFAIDVPDLGPVHALIVLAGDNVSARLWAEEPETAALFQENAGDLAAGLRAAAFEIEALEVVRGRPAAPRASADGPGHYRNVVT